MLEQLIKGIIVILIIGIIFLSLNRCFFTKIEKLSKDNMQNIVTFLGWLSFLLVIFEKIIPYYILFIKNFLGNWDKGLFSIFNVTLIILIFILFCGVWLIFRKIFIINGENWDNFKSATLLFYILYVLSIFLIFISK